MDEGSGRASPIAWPCLLVRAMAPSQNHSGSVSPRSLLVRRLPRGCPREFALVVGDGGALADSNRGAERAGSLISART